MSTIEVHTPALAAGAVQIEDAASYVNECLGTLDNAQTGSGQWQQNTDIADPNGLVGPAVWSAYSDMLYDAWTVMRALCDTLQTLGTNTALAGEGYFNTDHGVVPVSGLQGWAPKGFHA